MSVVIFGDGFSFPEGVAPTNRVYTYAKGFTENGVSVHVICFRNDYNFLNEGKTNGFHYYHPFGQTKRNKYFIFRNWKKILKYFKTIILLKRINKKEKITAITVYTIVHSTHLFAWFLSLITQSKLIKECSEHPLRSYQKNAFKKMQGLLQLNIESFLCNGIFCISHFLVNFYLDHGVAPSKLFLVPSTVDPTKFVEVGEKPLDFPYIGYFGGLTFKRDSIDTLVKAFAVLSSMHPELYLVLGGFCTEKEKKELEDLILQLNISNKVVLLKYLEREEIIRYITHSKILVMVRGKDMESDASFPSKLTEYLATSKPVIAVNVGEISDYLTDGENSVLIEPENCDMLIEKLCYILDNYQLAREIASRGKELTDTVFNYNFQARRMIGFIKSI